MGGCRGGGIGAGQWRSVRVDGWKSATGGGGGVEGAYDAIGQVQRNHFVRERATGAIMCAIIIICDKRRPADRCSIAKRRSKGKCPRGRKSRSYRKYYEIKLGRTRCAMRTGESSPFYARLRAVSKVDDSSPVTTSPSLCSPGQPLLGQNTAHDSSNLQVFRSSSAASSSRSRIAPFGSIKPDRQTTPNPPLLVCTMFRLALRNTVRGQAQVNRPTIGDIRAGYRGEIGRNGFRTPAMCLVRCI